MTRGARTAAVAALLAITGGALAGCAAPTSALAGATSSATVPPDAAQGTSPTATIQDAKPEDDPKAARDAVTAAVAAVTAYCRPNATKGEWIAALSPLLTDAGAVAYNTVDPATVPCSSYAGNASVRDGDDAYVFRVNVPTDAGTYEAYVTRPSTSGPWRVERMAPPE